MYTIEKIAKRIEFMTAGVVLHKKAKGFNSTYIMEILADRIFELTCGGPGSGRHKEGGGG